MRRKLVDQRYKLPYFVANPISRIGEPQANEDCQANFKMTPFNAL